MKKQHRNVNGEMFLTELRRSMITMLDGGCPADETQDRKKLYQDINGLLEAEAMWGDMLYDALEQLDRVDSYQAESIKDEVRSCRAHLQECKLLLREAKAQTRQMAEKLNLESRAELTKSKEMLSA